MFLEEFQQRPYTLNTEDLKPCLQCFRLIVFLIALVMPVEVLLRILLCLADNATRCAMRALSQTMAETGEDKRKNLQARVERFNGHDWPFESIYCRMMF